MLSLCLVIILFSFARISSQSGFSSPNYVATYGSGTYESDVVWYVGQTKTVVYDISDTALEDYTIALWQEGLGGGTATQGPVVYSVAASVISDSFEWVVALNSFDLDVSNVFFFWIFNGSSSNQGNTAFSQVSSAYFNISSDDPPTTSTSSTTTLSTSSSKTSKTTTLASTSTDSEASATATMNAAIDASSSVSSAVASATETSGSSSSGSDPSTGGGISTGAGVGIGVGVGLAGICAVVCAIIVVRGRQRKSHGPVVQVHELPPYSTMADKSAAPRPTYSELSEGGLALNYGHPAELMNMGRPQPVELYAAPGN